MWSTPSSRWRVARHNSSTGRAFLFACYTWSDIVDCRRAHRGPAEGHLGDTDVVLDRDERERVDRVSATPLPYPMWHQVINASDRMRPIDRWFAGLDRRSESDAVGQ